MMIEKGDVLGFSSLPLSNQLYLGQVCLIPHLWISQGNLPLMWPLQLTLLTSSASLKEISEFWIDRCTSYCPPRSDV